MGRIRPGGFSASSEGCPDRPTSILAALPERWRAAARLIGVSITTSFGSFVCGQLVSALVYGLLNAAVMVVSGLPYVLVVAPAVGLLIMVPLVGNYLVYLPPLLVTLGERPDDALLMFIVLAIMQGLYLNLIGPRIMAHAVGMHPLLTTAAILVFGQVGGFWGLFSVFPSPRRSANWRRPPCACCTAIWPGGSGGAGRRPGPTSANGHRHRRPDTRPALMHAIRLLITYGAV